MTTAYELAGIIRTGIRKASGFVYSRLVVDDAELVARTIKGDSEAFNEIVNRYQNFIYNIARGYLRNNESARDAAQDTFMKAYQGIKYFDQNARLDSWLFKICKNHCLNLLKRIKLEKNTEPEKPGTINPPMELQIRVKKYINRLDSDYRDILILRYYEDLKYDRIAEITGLSFDVVRIRLYRAKKMLKELMLEDENRLQ